MSVNLQAAGWAAVLGMQEDDLRLTTAKSNYYSQLDTIKQWNYPDAASYLAARQVLHNAYDQACRELGNPG